MISPLRPPESLETLLHPTDEDWKDSAFRPPLGQREFPDNEYESETTGLRGGLLYSGITVPVTTTQTTEASRGGGGLGVYDN